jgi:uroporphyrinogen-III decarboxylase
MPDVKQEYDERSKRISDAIALKETDRVPIGLSFQAFPYYWAGCTVQDAIHDYRKAGAALDKFYGHFKPDIGFDTILMYHINYMKTLGIKWFQWPGEHFEGPNRFFQFLEEEFMTADEYPEAIRDITKFMMSKWIPRSFSELKGLAKVDFRNTMWLNHMGAFYWFSDPEVKHALKALMKAGDELAEWFDFLAEYTKKMIQVHGIPSYAAGFAFAPFDMVGDTLRGTIEVLLDMTEHPDELLQLIDVFTDFAIKDTIASCSGKESKIVAFWLHKGVDEFMSCDNFAKFYWPSLRKYCLALIDAGLIPLLYSEGRYNTRFEYLKELPPKKTILHFEEVDMAAAKKALGGHSCIKGNISATMLAFGKKQEVIDKTKWLIDTCAPGGGYIMDSGALIDNALTENIEAVFETCLTYGVK